MTLQRGGFSAHPSTRWPLFAREPRELVPAPDPGDVATLQARVQAAQASLHQAAFTPPVLGQAPASLVVNVQLAIVRRHRARCPLCSRRRVMLAIEVTGEGFGGSEPRCADCWRIR